MKKTFNKYSKLLLLLGFILFLFQTALCMDFLNVILPVIEQEKGWSIATVNYILSVSTFIGVLTPTIFGTVYMKFGIRNTNVALVLIVGLATIGMGLSTSLAMFSASIAVVQIFAMAFLVGAPALMANWFFVKRGRALGIITIGAPVSTAVFTPVASYMVRTLGYGATFATIGALFIIIGGVLCAMVPNTPEEIGLTIDGANTKVEEPKEVKSIWNPVSLLKTKEAWLIIFGFGSVYLMMTAIMSQLIVRFTSQGITLETSLAILSASAVAGIPFSYLWGWLDDKISSPKTGAIFLLTYAVASIAMIFASTTAMWAAALAAFCIAATTGGMPNLIPSIMAWVYGKDEFLNVNRTIGLFHGVFRSAAFVLMGTVIGTFGTYTPAYVAFIGVSILGALALISIKRSYDPMNPAYQPTEEMKAAEQKVLEQKNA